jgi:hypothetical protein
MGWAPADVVGEGLVIDEAAVGQRAEQQTIGPAEQFAVVPESQLQP